VSSVKRLHWGCGRSAEPGWINSDINPNVGADVVADIRVGLPMESDIFDYIVTIHALNEIGFYDMPQVLGELRRVLKPGGVLRIAVPDLLKGVDAYRRGDKSYFMVPDADAASVGGKLVVQLMWYSYVRMLFTYDSLEEQLKRAGFSKVRQSAYRQTFTCHPEILTMDNRENETLFVEAEK
jgi:ubiquinone/menaquinone biosynthesis C-methylase UbiE